MEFLHLARSGRLVPIASLVALVLGNLRTVSRFGATFDAMARIRQGAEVDFPEVAIACGWSMLRIQVKHIEKQMERLERLEKRSD